jgi:hypothetical protein
MTVKLVRLKNGEDIIADLKEVVDSENTKTIAAIQFDTPFMVGIDEPTENMFVDESESGTKITTPRIRFFPWAPLSRDRILYIDPSQIVCIYDPYQQILEQYEKLVEAMNHGGGNDGNGGISTTEIFASEGDTSEGSE